MRFVEWCIVTVVIAALPDGRTEAQNAAPVSAGVTRRIQPAASERPSPDSNRTSLQVHMIRGGEIGGLAGLVLGGLALVAVSKTPCPVFAPSVSGGGDCSDNLSFAKWSAILLGSGVTGGLIGSVLGYAYHVNANEERAARCKASPAACT